MEKRVDCNRPVVNMFKVSRILKIIFSIFAFSLICVGCTSDKWGFPYRAAVQQGNWVIQEQVSVLRIGMSREQVRFVLGSPMLTSVLHASRWDYPYYYQPGKGPSILRKLTVWFENEKLVRWSSDEMPKQQPFQLTPRADNRL